MGKIPGLEDGLGKFAGVLECLYFTCSAAIVEASSTYYLLHIFMTRELHTGHSVVRLSMDDTDSLCTIIANEMAPDNASVKFEVHQCHNAT